jgi:outer membrane protein assembly factor BamB
MIFTIFLLVIPHIVAINNIEEMDIIHSGSYNKGHRYNIQGFVYVHIEGEPYERGYQYGYLAFAEIVDMINRWSNWGHKEDFMNIFIMKNRPDNYYELSKTYWNLCKNRAMKFFWDQYPEEFQQEIKGIADGVKARGGIAHGEPVDYKDILTLNEIEETRETFSNPGGRGRPFKEIFKLLKGAVKSILKGATYEISDRENHETGNCMAFLATGDATIDGRIVFSHSTIFQPNYIPQRANIILDVQPSKGHRFIMTVFPGYIWSSQDYYQNDCGILLAETSIWPPIGPWKVRGTTSIGVRARRAIQYSESIDDVINSMLDGNNGLYPADWIMGDTKTGEIASLELGLRSHAITRTKNGFLWSCCNAKDAKVRWDLWSIYGFGIPGRILRNIPPFKYTPTSFDKKFEELGNRYYGGIDVEVVKDIMATPPISNLPIDCKVTDSKLLENLGLWAQMGKTDGEHWTPKPEDQEILKGLTEVPGAGWVKIYGTKSQPVNLRTDSASKSAKKNSKVLWTYQTENNKNGDYSLSTVSGDTIYSVSSSSMIYALDKDSGKLLWKQEIGEKTVNPSASQESVFTGADRGLCALDKKTGAIKWEQQIGRISSKPIVSNNLIIAGCSEGEVYAFDINSGEQVWNLKLTDSVTLSEANDNTVFIGSGQSCHAFNIVEGEITWNYETEGVITKAATIDDKTVYIGSWDGNIYALDVSTGDLKWKYQTGWGIDTTPAISDSMVFVGSADNNFYALDKETGELKWFFTCKAAIHSSPTVYGEYVFFGSDDGIFYALDKTNGELVWDFVPGYSITDDNVNNYITTPILSNPVVENGIVYFDAKGTVYALDAQTFESVEDNVEKEPENNNLFLFILLIILGCMLIFFPFFKKNHKKFEKK